MRPTFPGELVVIGVVNLPTHAEVAELHDEIGIYEAVATCHVSVQ